MVISGKKQTIIGGAEPGPVPYVFTGATGAIAAPTLGTWYLNSTGKSIWPTARIGASAFGAGTFNCYFQVDESGGSTPDYYVEFQATFVAAGGINAIHQSLGAFVPPDGAYRWYSIKTGSVTLSIGTPAFITTFS